MISLQDPLRLSEGVLMVAGPMAPLLALLDGTRDVERLRVGFQLRTGVALSPNQITGFIEGLDDALLLDNRRFRDAVEAAIQSYRSAPFRPPALAGAGYPADPGGSRRIPRKRRWGRCRDPTFLTRRGPG